MVVARGQVKKSKNFISPLAWFDVIIDYRVGSNQCSYVLRVQVNKFHFNSITCSA